jgi:Family of unknown function (DUF6206)
MDNHQQILEDFERGLNPQSPEKSVIKAEVKGYGEISSIFSVEGISGWVFKRLPLFNKPDEANTYVSNYLTYTNALKQAGLNLPTDSANIVEGEKIVLYVGQQEYAAKNFCHNLLHTLNHQEVLSMINSILLAIKKVWDFNRRNKPELELSIDGQVSNWAIIKDRVVYVDTSTPLFKVNGKEQLDPELLLNSTPGALKWIIRNYFLKEVMERYYDLRLVFIDLTANLHKEQKLELITEAIDMANNHLPKDMNKITVKEVDAYYKDDKFTWQLFLFFRKIDRWLTNKVLRRNYQFILPGKIKR